MINSSGSVEKKREGLGRVGSYNARLNPLTTPPPPPQKNDVYCFWAVMKEKDTNEDGKF